MEENKVESIDNELNPKALGAKFNEDVSAFIDFLRQKIKSNPAVRFNIVADWVSVDKARAAKALLEYASRLKIDSITIRATRKQYEEDVNAFESGVKWEEV